MSSSSPRHPAVGTLTGLKSAQRPELGSPGMPGMTDPASPMASSPHPPETPENAAKVLQKAIGEANALRVQIAAERGRFLSGSLYEKRSQKQAMADYGLTQKDMAKASISRNSPPSAAVVVAYKKHGLAPFVSMVTQARMAKHDDAVDVLERRYATPPCAVMIPLRDA